MKKCESRETELQEMQKTSERNGQRNEKSRGNNKKEWREGEGNEETIQKLEKALREKEKVIEKDDELLRHQKRWLNDKDYTITRMQEHIEWLEWMEVERTKTQWEEEEILLCDKTLHNANKEEE